MATMIVSRSIPPQNPSADIASPGPPPKAEDVVGLTSSTHLLPRSAPLLKKHVSVCPTDPSKAGETETPPASPQSTDYEQQRSMLCPPDGFTRIDVGHLSVYEIKAKQVAHALEFAAKQPLPLPSSVFPWLHGLHPENQIQQAFFLGRPPCPSRTPTCLRGITLVKANGDLGVARLKGAIAPDEFLRQGPVAEFIEADPLDGFSVRNFQIQTAKTALTSDIIVYGDDAVEVRRIAWAAAAAQSLWRQQHSTPGNVIPDYNTFACSNSFDDFEKHHGSLVAVDSRGKVTGNILDFIHQERREMWDMTMASEISHNVYMGPTPDIQDSGEQQQFDILIECCDLGRLNPAALRSIAEDTRASDAKSYLEFPSSGSILPPTWSHDEADGIVETCRWIYHLSHGISPVSPATSAADSTHGNRDCSVASAPDPSATAYRPRKILMHCADGYTESSMLGLAYFSYSTGRTIPDAWLHLHTSKRRNFFAYPNDVALLTAIGPRLLRESPVCSGKTAADVTKSISNEPTWLRALDGSLPSRILDYLYLGNLSHANNPDLLREFGIKQILSVGETAAWRDGYLDKWGPENVCVVQGVQDNGIDSLTDKFAPCLEFIDRGRRMGTATLVHCRVGVSRSATICIAEVMRALKITFPRAYCFVRVRRLNVIIQPHLRFAYELLRWEERLRQQDSAHTSVRRELEWGEIAREIAFMNRPYSR